MAFLGAPAADWQVVPELHAPVFGLNTPLRRCCRIDTPQGTVSVLSGEFSGVFGSRSVFDMARNYRHAFWLWIANDACPYTLLVEAETPISNCRINSAFALMRRVKLLGRPDDSLRSGKFLTTQ